MEMATQALPNQVEPTEVANTGNRENKNSEDIKEIRDYVHNIRNIHNEEIKELKDLNKKMGEEMENIRKQRDESGDGRFVKVIQWVAITLITLSAGYWNYETLVTYRSEPLMSTTNIIQNTTFTWPTITVEPPHTCYNITAYRELRKIHKIKWGLPFNITDKNFKWSENNVNKMYLQTKYRPPIANFTSRCLYNNAATAEYNCYKEEMGKWETYDTQYGAKQSFTPAPASSIRDNIYIEVNTYNCYYFIVAIHPSTDRFYNTHPSAQHLYINARQDTFVRIAVQEFHRVSTRSHPCVDDIHFSQVQCHDTKLIEYHINKAGCHFPAITGYQQHEGNFPECNNYSSFQRFMHWHKELYSHEYKYEDLQRMKAECGEPCHTKRYFTTEMVKGNHYDGNRPQRQSTITLRMDTRAMSYLSINEQRAMTMEELVANVGGTLGLFLGISFLTAISTVKFLIKKIIKFYRKD